jgi:hypothetical protein
VNQEWLGFTGSIIGGLITAGAGAAAWIAAQRTINVTRAVAERREDATYRVIQHELSPKVEMFVRYWRVIQRASKGGPEIKRNGEVLIRSIFEDGTSENWFDEMRRLGSDLGPIKRRELIDVLLGMRLVRDQIKIKNDGENRQHTSTCSICVRCCLTSIGISEHSIQRWHDDLIASQNRPSMIGLLPSTSIH